jgi:hypothetical protein
LFVLFGSREDHLNYLVFAVESDCISLVFSRPIEAKVTAATGWCLSLFQKFSKAVAKFGLLPDWEDPGHFGEIVYETGPVSMAVDAFV